MKENTECAVTSIRHRTRTILFLFMVLVLACASLRAQSDQDSSIHSYDIPVGEKLLYHIDWDPPWYLFFLPHMHAGDAELSIEKGDEFQGNSTYRIQFKVTSTGTLVSLAKMEVQDEFLFLSSSDDLCTLKVSKKIREGKRKRQIEVEYFQDTGQLHMMEYDHAVDPHTVKKDVLKNDIPACVRDPFSALYDMRRQLIGKDTVISSVIGHDDIVKEVQSRVEKLEALDTTAGKIPAWRIRTESLVQGLFKKGGEFKIWLSADNRQVPLKFEVKVPLGRVLGILKETENVER